MTRKCEGPESGPPLNDSQIGAISAARPALRVDIERYKHHLNGSALTESQQRDLLEALWSIMHAFVDLGFRVGAGETLTKEGDFGMDHVLHSIILEETAHETVASELTDHNTEQR